MKKNPFLSIISNQIVQVVFLISGIALVIWLAGRSTGRREVVQVKYPSSEDLSDPWKAQGDAFVSRIQSLIDGTPWLSWGKNYVEKQDFFKRLETLADNQVRYVYNAWNSRFQRQEGGLTLTKRLKDEKISPGSMDRFIQRLTSLNLL